MNKCDSIYFFLHWGLWLDVFQPSYNTDSMMFLFLTSVWMEGGQGFFLLNLIVEALTLHVTFKLPRALRSAEELGNGIQIVIENFSLNLERDNCSFLGMNFVCFRVFSPFTVYM